MRKEVVNRMIEGYDGKEHRVVVCWPNGGGSYHVMVDNYYVGQIVKYSIGWTPFVKSEYLTADDIDAIIDRIEEAED